MTDRPDHFMALVKQYWAQLVALFMIVGALITMWFELKFVIAAVNPESLAEYRVENAVLETKREIRWCLGKLVVLDTIEKEAVLKCAD